MQGFLALHWMLMVLLGAGAIGCSPIGTSGGGGGGGGGGSGGGGSPSCPADPDNAVTVQLAAGAKAGSGGTLYLDSPTTGTTGGAGTVRNCPNADNGIALDTGFNIDQGDNFVEPTFPANSTSTLMCNGVSFPPGTYKMAIRSVGPVCGVGAVSASTSAGTGTAALAIAGNGYVFTTPDQQIHRMYVVQITPNTVGGIYGPEVVIVP